jgi:mono/diheme cytochrome c family protein
MARFNCHACHTRDGEGGPSPSRSDYFTSLSELDLGDEGRLPPHLSDVGNKLRAEWLGQVLTNAGVVRPYMAVRMPQFGAVNTAALVQDFIAADLVAAASSNRPPAGDPRAGAELVGLGGYSCVTCHSFGPHPSLGISVMDLTQMSKRLHWDWFQRYLRDPASLRPGTRMPAFWPEDQASVRHLLGGDTARQIASIWAYLSLGVDAPPPPGLLESLGRLHDPGSPLPGP